MARWRAAKEAETGDKDRRPYLASECTDVGKCEKWRLEIIREISKKVAQIQNAGLGEFRIRDLNDEINKLLREKRHWENQISALGGPHYRRYGPKMFDAEGREVPGNRGYKYFGAAKDLPGVRELFEQEPPPPPRKTRAELMRDVDADYYGYRDDDDGVLVPLEERAERVAMQKAAEEWRERQRRNAGGGDADAANAEEDDDEDLYPAEVDPEARRPAATAATDRLDDDEPVDPMQLLAPRFTAHVPVPTQKDIEAALLRKRKEELLKKYCME